jgi:hypothetical protein
VTAHYLSDRIPFVTDIRPAPTLSLFADFLVLSGAVLGIRVLLRPGRMPLMLAAIVLPVFMLFGTENLWELDAGVSARPAAQSAIDHLPPAELATATTYKLQRGLKFTLSFYLHRELAEWSPPAGRSSIVFTSQAHTNELQQLGVHCFHYIAFPAVEICVDSSTIASSADNPANSRQPQ